MMTTIRNLIDKRETEMPSAQLAGVAADRAYYDRVSEFKDESVQGMLRLIEGSFSRYRANLGQRFSNRTDVSSIEFGAGSCTLSLLLGKEKYVSRQVCLDISVERMKALAPRAADYTGGKLSQLELLQGDLSAPTEFPDASFDLVLFDGALHHSRSIWATLAEARRLIKPEGLLVAQREHFLAALTHPWKLRRLLQSEEVIAGVSENVYLRGQYDYYLQAAGFQPRFVACAETPLQRFLSPLNGWVYSKWVVLAEPVRASTQRTATVARERC